VTTPTVLVATWGEGLFVVRAETSARELVHQSVRALAPDGHGAALAIVNGRSLRRRAPDGVWSTIATRSSPRRVILDTRVARSGESESSLSRLTADDTGIRRIAIAV
jgi:hypothetical protein